MSQTKQLKKVKKYRVLKVVFYFLGLPLFMLAVFITATRFLGQPPFVGTSDLTSQLGFFNGYEQLFTSPALFGVWIAVAVWLIISVFHLILAKTVKSRRARMFAVLALVLVVMFGGTLVMDAVFDANIDKMIENAPAGVTVQDYRSQLSYYRYVSYGRKKTNLTYKLQQQVQQLERVYNVEMEGVDKSGVAGNIANKPIDYYYIISDPDPDTGAVEMGVDISFRLKEGSTYEYELALDEEGNFIPDGKKTLEVEGNQLVRLQPNANNELVINGKVYSHYFPVSRTASNGNTIYIWYTKDMMPTSTTYSAKGVKHLPQDGVYGKALYNESGLLSDGWIFSVENVLRILEDYYAGQAELAALEKQYTDQFDTYNTLMSEILTESAQLRNEYYNGEEADPWLHEFYNQEVVRNENFSLTRGELDFLLSQVGVLLGDNHLFDWLFKSDELTEVVDGVGGLLGAFGGGNLGAILEPILGVLENGGIALSSILTLVYNGSYSGEQLTNQINSTIATAAEWIRPLLGKDESYQIKDIYIQLAYKNEQYDHLYIAVRRDNGNGAMGTEPEDVLIDIDFDDALLDAATNDYAFDLDHLSAFLNVALNGLLGKLGVNLSDSGNIINTILGLFLKDIEFNGSMYKGLVISGISIPLINSAGRIDIDINGILTDLLQNWYVYQSPVVKPIWEFYEKVPISELEPYKLDIAKALAKYERAMYEATVYGSMIGSTLIGDTLGGGTYASSFGLNDLASVQQLISDLSYMPVYFPIYACRDMMLTFAGLVIIFYLLSFVAAEKEEQYATGKLLGKLPSKAELEKELEAAPASPDPSTVSFTPTGEATGETLTPAAEEQGEQLSAEAAPETDTKPPLEGEGQDVPPTSEGGAPAVPANQNNEKGVNGNE